MSIFPLARRCHGFILVLTCTGGTSAVLCRQRAGVAESPVGPPHRERLGTWLACGAYRQPLLGSSCVAFGLVAKRLNGVRGCVKSVALLYLRVYWTLPGVPNVLCAATVGEFSAPAAVIERMSSPRLSSARETCRCVMVLLRMGVVLPSPTTSMDPAL